MKNRLVLALAAVLLLAFPQAQRAATIEIEPVYSLQLLGGQYFFTEGHSKLGGNISGLIAPGVRFNEKWEFYPSYGGSYRGTKDVVDLVGAGTVFQEQMDHRAGAKVVYIPNGGKWKVKPSASYTLQFLKETKDERWSKGLFDYRKIDFGLEGEYIYSKPFSVRASLSCFMTSFPNYTSLESQAALDFQGQALARELVGDKVLNTNGQLLSLQGNIPLRKLILEGSYSIVHQGFPNQPVVDAAGALTTKNRSDLTQSLEGGLKMPWNPLPKLKLVFSLDFGFAYNDSNQNSYDAFQTKFIEGHYDYREFRRQAGARAVIGEADWPTVISMDFAFSDRNYLSRRIQDSTGLYQSDTLDTRNVMLSASVSRPLAPRFKALLTIQHGISDSNQGFQQFYTYDYTATNYLLGVSYDYGDVRCF